MVAVYLLSGPLVFALCFVAFLLRGAGLGEAAISSILIGCLAPVLLACLHVAFNSKLRLKIINKLPVKSRN
ncbi:hypothetical protein [Ruegeria atlantica]|uniref:hypothetical protein n=1 Tax=Ruegeria atlantica TaxID=81569 RepID=UPI00147CAFC5|nr:hypothetical protein [Ruegeria atlantica]